MQVAAKEKKDEGAQFVMVLRPLFDALARSRRLGKGGRSSDRVAEDLVGAR